ncbi:MAG: hypothetical protein K2W94_07280 [Alphaproteobacteria bacterium]|nr:hypothetical protein [Alphaproteobacteria bacterium]
MKSLLFIMFFLTFLQGCSNEKMTKDDYVNLVPVKNEKPVKDKPIMDEISEHKGELEKLNSIHKYVIDETNEQNSLP